MSKNVELPKLNSFQAKKIMEHLKKNNGVNKKDLMDKLSEDITEVLMLNGLNNSECSYVLLNVQRHILELKKNRESLENMNIEVAHLNQNIELNSNVHLLSYIMDRHAKVYRNSVDSNGKPKC